MLPYARQNDLDDSRPNLAGIGFCRSDITTVADDAVPIAGRICIRPQLAPAKRLAGKSSAVRHIDPQLATRRQHR